MKDGVKKLTLFRFPLAYSFSPLIHQFFGEQLQIPLEYTQTEVKPGDLKKAVISFHNEGGIGANVTMPLKEEAFTISDKVTPRAKIAKSVNTFFWKENQLWGDNTDGIGLLKDITQNHGYSLKDKVICILGAGGAAAGIIASLEAHLPKEIIICNRTLERAHELQKRFSSLTVTPKILNFKELDFPVDWIINTTPLNAFESLSTLNPIVVKNTFVYEITYSKDGKPLPFTTWALDNEAKKVFDGLGMLVEQAAESFSKWFEIDTPETKSVIKQLRNKPLVTIQNFSSQDYNIK